MKKACFLKYLILLLMQFSVIYMFGQKNTKIDSTNQVLEVLFKEVSTSNNVRTYFDFIKNQNDSLFLAKMDTVLANYIAQTGMIWEIEAQLNTDIIAMLPVSMSAIYTHYSASGIWGDLERFKEKHPSYIAKTSYEEDLQLTNLGSQLLEKDTTISESALIQYIKQAAPKQNALWVLQKLLSVAINEKEEVRALNYIKEVAPAFQENPTALNELKQLLEVPIIQAFPKTNMGETLNSEGEEYAAVLSASGKELYFCRQENNKERIFYAIKEGNNWSAASEVEELYYGRDRAPLSLTADASKMVLFENGGIYHTQKSEDGWTTPAPLSNRLNEAEWQGGTTLSADGSVLIFCSRRGERIGVDSPENTDLFISFKDTLGNWSAPKNLGITLNTNYSERSPFLHPDGKTLYFSTNGRGGLGGLDVYKSTKQEGDWFNWTKPMNLGRTTNTTEDDWGYTVSANGKYALFSSSHPVRGDQDLFMQELAVGNQPQAISTIAGKLLDADKQPIGANIVIEDVETGERISEYQSDPKTGEYIIVLPDNRLYSYTILKKGFYYYSDQLDLKTTSTKQLVKNIKLDRLSEMVKSSIKLPIKNLSFESGKDTIQPSSYIELNHLAEMVKGNDLHIRLEGHTDDIGTEADNLRLSEQRAKAVENYLRERGCSGVIKIKGHGSLKPKIDGKTIEARNANRRVEISIIPK